MKVSNIKERITLTRELSQWEIKRVDRLITEELLRSFTGLMDIVELHTPYTRYDLLNKIIEKAKKHKGKRIMILDGDSLNLDLFSRFHKRSTDNSKPSEEIEKLLTVISVLSKVYDNIVYLTTNHENRYEKVILDNIQDKGVAEEVLKQMKTLKEYFEIYPNLIYTSNYFLQIGDVIVCHMENNSSVPGALSRDLVSYFKPRINKTFNAIFQAHTHGQSWVPVDRVVVVETGALIDSLDYWRDGKMKGKRKMSSIGYGTCLMNDGRVILESCKPVIMDWEGYL